MKRIKKLLCVMVALVMSLCIFAMAACDNNEENSSQSDSVSASGSEDTTSETTDSSPEETEGTEGGDNEENAGNTMLSTALLAAINDIYTSTTGYQFTITADYTMTGESVVSGYGFDATILTQSDGENFNTDGDIYLSATNGEITDGVTTSYTTYEYISALLRGTGVYAAMTETNEEGMTDSEKAELGYLYADIAELSSLVTENETLSPYLALIGSGSDGITTAIGSLVSEIFSELTGVINTTLVSTGTAGTYELAIALSYDLSDVLLEYVTAADDMLTFIVTTSAVTGDYTVNDLFSDFTVQAALYQYLDGMTGEDIYQTINSVSGIISSVYADITSGTLGELTLPEGTAEQSAYEYIMTLASDDYFGSYVLNTEEVMAYINMAAAMTSELKSALEDTTISLKFTLDRTTYALSSISFDIHGLVISGYEIDLDFDISMESTEVTLTDVSGITYSNLTDYFAVGV